jgi:hypothetical protein
MSNNCYCIARINLKSADFAANQLEHAGRGGRRLACPRPLARD